MAFQEMADRAGSSKYSRHLVVFAAIITVILVVSALRSTSVVMIPLAWAVFTISLVRPLQLWLEERMPNALALIVTFVSVLAALALFCYGIVLSIDQIVDRAPQYSDRVMELYHGAITWLESQGIPVGGQTAESQGMSERLMSMLGGLVSGIWGFVGLFVVVIALLLLSLSEVGLLRSKLSKHGENAVAEKVLSASRDAAQRVRRYMWAVMLTSVGTGLATGLFTWAIGLDFPFVWGMLAFLLNFIPTIGSVIAVIPPVLVALVSPEAAWLAPTTLAGLSVIQIAFGYYIDPLVQGRFVKLSPVVVLFSMIFWGWVWGIAGAFLSVPLTVAIAAFCRHWETTEWIGYALSEDL